MRYRIERPAALGGAALLPDVVVLDASKVCFEDGALVIRDRNGELITAYAPGQWRSITEVREEPSSLPADLYSAATQQAAGSF